MTPTVEPLTAHKFVFVGGLHRSGTTPLARWLEQHPEVSGLSGTGVWEDEGQHLQTVYPPARDFGGPGRFAFRQTGQIPEEATRPHLRTRLLEEWGPHWDLDRRVLVEKSPPNLVRMRFLQALFPEAAFVVVTRHPVAVAYATQKWSRTSLDSLIHHWLAAHDWFLEDAAYVRAVTIVRYEDLMAHPGDVMRVLHKRLGIDPQDGERDVKPGLNAKYLARFEPGGNPLKALRARGLAWRYEDRVARFGYSIRDTSVLQAPAPEVARYLVDSS